MSGPAGHKRAWQVCPGKLPLQPSEHRRICGAAAHGFLPGTAIIGSKNELCPEIAFNYLAGVGAGVSNRNIDIADVLAVETGQRPDYIADYYGRCRLDRCRCLDTTTSWLGRACPHWEPANASTWDQLRALVARP